MSNNNPIPNNKPFQKGQSGNPNGRPPKNYNALTKQLKKQGYEIPTKSEFAEFIGLLMVLTEFDMKAMQADETAPHWVRSTITDLLNSSTRPKLMADYRDWLFNKAAQPVEPARLPLWLSEIEGN